MKGNFGGQFRAVSGVLLVFGLLLSPFWSWGQLPVEPIGGGGNPTRNGSAQSYEIYYLKDEMPAGCGFQFYQGYKFGKLLSDGMAEQGEPVKVQVVLPIPNPHNYRLLPRSITFSRVTKGSEGDVIGQPQPVLGDPPVFDMPATRTLVSGVFVKGLTVRIQPIPPREGRISVSKLDSYKSGDRVMLEVHREDGYDVKSIEVMARQAASGEPPVPVVKEADGVNYSFVMPDDDVIVTAKFEPKTYTITTKIEVLDGDPASVCKVIFDRDPKEYKYGEKAVIRPVPALRYRLMLIDERLASQGSSAPVELERLGGRRPPYNEAFEYTMPSEDVELTFGFKIDPDLILNVPLLVRTYLSPQTQQDVTGKVKVRYNNKQRTTIASGSTVKEGEELLVRCDSVAGYHLTSMQIAGVTYQKRDSVIFTVPNVPKLEVRVYYTKSKVKPAETRTSVEDDRFVDVYPNPLSDHVTVAAEGISRVQLLTQEGHLILDQPHRGGKLQLPPLARGVYLLRVLFDDGTMSTRRVVR